MGGQAGATRDCDKVMKASKWFIFLRRTGVQAVQAWRDFKAPSQAAWEQWRLGEPSGAFAVFVSYPGRFVAEQNSAHHARQQLAKAQIPKARLSFQSITELLPSGPKWQTWGNMGSVSWGEAWVRVSRAMGKKCWQFFCWDVEVLQV